MMNGPRVNSGLNSECRTSNGRFVIRNSAFDIRHSPVGQVTMEYFILFAIVAFLTVLMLSNRGNQFRSSVEGFVNGAAARITR